MPRPIPFPQYDVGDHVAIRPNEDYASQIVHGKVKFLTWSRIAQDHLYGIAVPRLEGMDPELVIVRECEIWGWVGDDVVSPDSVASAASEYRGA